MTVLASIDGSLFFVMIAAVIGVINWLTKKNESSGTKPTPKGSGASPSLPRGGTGEEERMRKFLEALGVPADQGPPPIQPRPTIARNQPLPKIQSRSPVVAQPIYPSYTKQRKPPVLPPKRRVVFAEKPPEPQFAVPIPPLETPPVSEFETTSSHVSAIPLEAPATEVWDAFRQAPELPSMQLGNSIRDLLRTPRSLRDIVLLREILGPPRGLPNASALPTLI